MLQKDNQNEMKERLEKLVKEGAELYLDGKRVSAEELAQTCCVNEESVYMPDYVVNQEGRLTQLRYDRVRLT
ncbi:hypothetical protein V1224_14755 [Lachnospiraceae bacterium JLR.KK008]